MDFFKDSNFNLRTYEFNDSGLWFALDDVLKILELTEKDTEEAKKENPEDFRTLLDGTKIIHEGIFYYLMIFVSKTPDAKKFADLVMNDIVKSILSKGYYINKGE